MHVIEQLAAFAARHPTGTLTVSTKEACKILVTDLLAATAAGLQSALATAARKAAVSVYGPGPATVWLTDIQLSIAGAAMANAAAASALDIDDGHRGAAGHAGAGIIPAVLAVAQATCAGDEEILDAIAIGYDIALRVGSSRPTSTIESFSSGRWVAFGVAAATGRLLRLSPLQLANAIAISGAEGPLGMRRGTSIGSTVKEAIPPAVVAGITAAFRAAADATGPLDFLDNDHLFTRSVMMEGLGAHWWLEDCYLKPYACCRFIHAAIDAILDLKRPGTQVSSLRIETFQRGMELSNDRAPRTLEGAQYSYYFCVALAALYGRESLQPISPERLCDSAVLALAARIELVAHPEFANSFPKTTPCRVILDQGEGRETRTVKYPLGDVANPMTREQVADKFHLISAASLDPQRQKSVLDCIDALTDDGFSPLFAALRPSWHDTQQRLPAREFADAHAS